MGFSRRWFRQLWDRASQLQADQRRKLVRTRLGGLRAGVGALVPESVAHPKAGTSGATQSGACLHTFTLVCVSASIIHELI